MRYIKQQQVNTLRKYSAKTVLAITASTVFAELYSQKHLSLPFLNFYAKSAQVREQSYCQIQTSKFSYDVNSVRQMTKGKKKNLNIKGKKGETSLTSPLIIVT